MIPSTLQAVRARLVYAWILGWGTHTGAVVNPPSIEPPRRGTILPWSHRPENTPAFVTSILRLAQLAFARHNPPFRKEDHGCCTKRCGMGWHRFELTIFLSCRGFLLLLSAANSRVPRGFSPPN